MFDYDFKTDYLIMDNTDEIKERERQAQEQNEAPQYTCPSETYVKVDKTSDSTSEPTQDSNGNCLFLFVLLLLIIAVIAYIILLCSI